MARRIRLGIIGTGFMGQTHAKEFAKIPGVELTVCCDVDAGRARSFAKQHGLRHAVTDLSAVLEMVDAVAVVTPDRTHAPLSLAILRAGKHLLCEKPLTVTLDEARHVLAEARRATAVGVIHMINFTYRRSAALQAAITLARSGQLGDIRHVSSAYRQSWLRSEAWGRWDDPTFLWRLQSSAGSLGALGDTGCHILDFTTAVVGELESVGCRLHTFPKLDRQERPQTRWQGRALDANDTALIDLRFTGGAVGVCQVTRWATGYLNELSLEVHGTHGALAIRHTAEIDTLHTCLGADIHPARWTPATLPPVPNMYERFVRAIRTGEPAQPDLPRGALVQAYLEACLNSVRMGMPADIPELEAKRQPGDLAFGPARWMPGPDLRRSASACLCPATETVWREPLPA